MAGGIYTRRDTRRPGEMSSSPESLGRCSQDNPRHTTEDVVVSGAEARPLNSQTR